MSNVVNANVGGFIPPISPKKMGMVMFGSSTFAIRKHHNQKMRI